METLIATVLSENGICNDKFSHQAQAWVPAQSWIVPEDEILARWDLRNMLTVTIDSSSAKELDDALSIEIVEKEVYRLGVHIADVAYFVQPDSALDKEAMLRSSSVYLVQNKLPMLPPELSQGLATLRPGQDRLVVSIVWEVDSSGNILDRWIGRSVICSCCKLSYNLVEDLIGAGFNPTNMKACTIPNLYGSYCWTDIVKSLEILYNFSLKLKGSGKGSGEANAMVEKFMLLANQSVAQVISSSLPDRALLRHHPDPSIRRLHGLKVQPASYFSAGDLKGENYNWRCDGFPAAYTHFTSPLRRYPDIIVHRTLLAVLEAEKIYIIKREGNFMARCFTGLKFDMEAAETEDGKEALLHAVTKFGVPEADELCKLATYFNEKKSTICHVEETAKKIHLQATSQKQKVVWPQPLDAVPACQGPPPPFPMQNLTRQWDPTTANCVRPPPFSQRLMVPLQHMVPRHCQPSLNPHTCPVRCYNMVQYAPANSFLLFGHGWS